MRRVGTSASASARAIPGARAPLRTTTASSLHGTPCSEVLLAQHVARSPPHSRAGVVPRCTVASGGRVGSDRGGATRGAPCAAARPQRCRCGGDGVRERRAAPDRLPVHDARARDSATSGQPEPLGQPAQRVGLAAAERVRRDIRIPEGDDRDAAAGEGAQDRERRLGRLLEVVDEHEPEPRDPVVREAAFAIAADREPARARRSRAGARG